MKGPKDVLGVVDGLLSRLKEVVASLVFLTRNARMKEGGRGYISELRL